MMRKVQLEARSNTKQRRPYGAPEPEYVRKVGRRRTVTVQAEDTRHGSVASDRLKLRWDVEAEEIRKDLAPQQGWDERTRARSPDERL